MALRGSLRRWGFDSWHVAAAAACIFGAGLSSNATSEEKRPQKPVSSADAPGPNMELKQVQVVFRRVRVFLRACVRCRSTDPEGDFLFRQEHSFVGVVRSNDLGAQLQARGSHATLEETWFGRA